MLKQAAILGGIILAVYVASRYALAKRYEVWVKKIKFSGSLQAPELLLTLAVNNPTPYLADVSKISGKIYANDSLIATIDQAINTRINKEAVTDLTLPIKVLPVGSLLSILTYFTDKSFKIVIDGFIIVDNLPIPVKYTYDK